MTDVKRSDQIRDEFIAFFEKKGHKFVRSSPVVPQDDPTLLFTNAGMNQFKDVFLGSGQRDYSRAVNSQKCIRASGKHNDLEDVGRDNYHHTFFEMLGNWSFGDYFKRDAIAWAWELLVEQWGLPADKLYATVFGGDEADGLAPDEEAESLWLEVTSLPRERVLRCGKKDNFWEMGDTGPCGPCSEIHIDLGAGTCPLSESHHCAVNTDGCFRFIELWNLVFVQFDRKPDGKLRPLPAQHVDTGMGFERIARVLQQVGSNYDTDLFVPLLDAIGELCGRPYEEHGEGGVAFRVIADHLRALSFAIADGALPANDGRGYVLRRMLRRAARFGRVLHLRDPFIHRLVPRLAAQMGAAFPELAQQAEHVSRVILAEEESFATTLDRGLELFEGIVSEHGEERIFPGHEAFKLYDTYGFPVDLTRLMAEERGFQVDMAGFDTLMEEQRAQAKAAGKATHRGGDWVVLADGADSRFEGYDTLELETRLMRYRPGKEGTWEIILERTPFYAESGGQVGDQGTLSGEAGRWRVVDTQKEGDRIVHICEGQAEPRAGGVTASVDAGRRRRTTLNHTATHLMHAALRAVLGPHVTQAGSIVAPDYLRFDYTHFEKPTREQLDDVEHRVNEMIRTNRDLEVYQTSYDEAIAGGIMALFGEKYGDRVRVVNVPGFSQELCGGAHVRATGDIGLFTIVSESSIATGVRRIVALTGDAAEAQLRQSAQLVEQLRQKLNAPPEQIVARLEQMLEERRQLEKELKSLRQGQMASGADSLLSQMQSVDGLQVLASEVQAGSVQELRAMADSLRQKMQHGVAVLGAVINGKGSLLCVVSEDLVRDNVKAGDIVNEIAALADGRGGGPPHMATAGAKDVSKMSLAVQRAPELIHAYMAARSG